METDSDDNFSTPPGTPKTKTKKHGQHIKNDLDNKPSTKSSTDKNKKQLQNRDIQVHGGGQPITSLTNENFGGPPSNLDNDCHNDSSTNHNVVFNSRMAGSQSQYCRPVENTESGESIIMACDSSNTQSTGQGQPSQTGTRPKYRSY